MEILLLIAGLVGLVWGALLFSRGSLLGGCVAVLLVGTCFGADFFNVPMSPMPLTLDRALMGLLVLSYAACRFRRSPLVDPKPLGREEIVLFAFVGLLLASTFTHDWGYAKNEPVRKVLFLYLLPLGLYWIARQSAITERRVFAMYGCLAMLGVYLAVTAIAEFTGQWWAVFPKYIVDPSKYEFLGRGRGPLLNPIGNGIVLAVSLACTTMWWPRLHRPGRLLLVAAIVLILTGMYGTLTRSVWMGAALAIFILGALTLPKSWRAVTLGGMLLLGTVVVATKWESILSFKRDKEVSAEDVEGSAKLRPLLAMVAWKMFQDRPLWGFGYGQYSTEASPYVADRTVDAPLEKTRPYVQHSLPLALLVELGAAGLGLFLLLIYFWLHDAWSLWTNRDAPLWVRQQGLVFMMMIGGFVPNSLFHDVSLIPMVNMYLFLLAGVTRGLVLQTLPAPTPELSTGRETLFAGVRRLGGYNRPA